MSFLLKRFDETIDTPSLLYVLADPTFFRVRCFNYLLAQQSRYKDKLDESLGRQSTSVEFETAVFDYYATKDKVFKENNFLYYPISNIYSLQDCVDKVLELALDAENTNRIARQNLGMRNPIGV